MSLKTQPTDESVMDYLSGVKDETQRKESMELLKIFERATKEKGVMWGKNMVGFGSYSYVNTTKKPATFFRTGFSPRKGKLSLYLMPGYDHEKRQELLTKLGKYNLGKCCLTFKKLTDVKSDVLEKIVKSAWDSLAEKHPFDEVVVVPNSAGKAKRKSAKAGTKRKAAATASSKSKSKSKAKSKPQKKKTRATKAKATKKPATRAAKKPAKRAPKKSPAKKRKKA